MKENMNIPSFKTKDDSAQQGKIWFSSDHHFHHENIIKYCNRPFYTVEQMNREMIQRWNETVQPEDTVYYLGDFSLGKIEVVEPTVKSLHGKKLLIAGNHDRVHPANKKVTPISRYIEAGFEDVVLEMTLELTLKGVKQTVKLCHLPYAPLDPDEQVDRRYLKMRPKDEGQLLLHGHVHEAWLKSKCGRMLNVGVDRWDFYPISVEQIESAL